MEKWIDSSTIQVQSLSMCDGQLLVTPQPPTSQLIQYSEDGREVCRVSLPDNTTPHHAAMTPRGTFLVCCTTARRHGTSDSDDLHQVTCATLLAYFICRPIRKNLYVATRSLIGHWSGQQGHLCTYIQSSSHALYSLLPW